MDAYLRVFGSNAADTASLSLVCLVALGMALSFYSADRQSPTSRALALSLVSIALSLGLSIVLPAQWSMPLAATRWFALADMVAMIAMLEWVLRVRRTVPARDLNTRGGDRALRSGQMAALFYGVCAVAFPEIRAHDFLGALSVENGLYRPGFWLFAGPILYMLLAALSAMLLLWRRRPDPVEKQRMFAMLAALPFLGGSFIVPRQYVALMTVIGLMIILLGSVHYHVLQGQRGQFLSRFLSPQVATLVRERGLAQAMQHQNIEITAVCCDIRGFTAYAAGHASEQVIGLLGAYYECVGKLVADSAATIKDYAGDGILILVGAPLPVADHAEQGLKLARAVSAAVRLMLRQHTNGDASLGLGVGVATGWVTVGAIGSDSRLEYAAVGSAVNLASRLCERARDGEVLASVASLDAHPASPAELRQAESIKGFGEQVPYYALTLQGV